MGKHKKARSYKQPRESLTQQIMGLETVPGKASRPGPGRAEEDHQPPTPPPHDDPTELESSCYSHQILEQARLQQEELEEEFGLGGSSGGSKLCPHKAGGVVKMQEADEGEEEDGESEGGIDSGDYCPVVLEEDERAMEKFMSREQQPRLTLAVLIQDKIRDKETEIATQMTEASGTASCMDDRVISVFKSVGTILSKYRSGKLPKAFKMIPALSNWEEVLYLTEPEKWTAAAMFQATRIFASNMNSGKAQRFYNLVLLPRVRDDISEFKRLNFHLYMSLRKSLFKPAAFFKGILLPLCESGTCTLREALIVGSVLAKNSIPMLHSSAALLKVAEMDYTGANSIFIRTLLDKKYALPYRVIDALVFHFTRFAADERELPVLWHQSLLTFVQRYKEDMSAEQKEGLLELLRTKCHHEITPEVRREIVNSKCRDMGKSFVERNS